MLDLLDVFVTADRITNFTSHLTHSGTKEIRTREQLRPLIILNIFGEATNVGIKRKDKHLLLGQSGESGKDRLVLAYLRLHSTPFSPFFTSAGVKNGEKGRQSGKWW